MTQLRKSRSDGIKPRPPKAGKQRATLETTSLESVDSFVRILGRCGESPEAICSAVQDASSRIPEQWVHQGQQAAREIGDASHVLTVWFTDPEYLDLKGNPRSLPLEGISGSISALVRTIDRQLNPRDVLRYLVKTRAVSRHGARYVPRDRTVLLRGARGPDYFRTLRVLSNLLRTLEHNVLPKNLARGWFEYFAENPRFPVRCRPALDAFVNDLGKEMLSQADTYMRRREMRRRPGEPTMRVGLGVQLWEGGGEAVQPYPSNQKTRTLRKDGSEVPRRRRRPKR